LLSAANLNSNVIPFNDAADVVEAMVPYVGLPPTAGVAPVALYHANVEIGQ